MANSVSLIIGAGALGIALAARLAAQGHVIMMAGIGSYTSSLDTIKSQGSTVSVDERGRYQVNIVATEDAIRHADFIFITMPTDGHPEVIEALKSHDLSSKVVFVLPAGFF
ncbi:unnamed protein product, partial [Ectocarpus sp. 4 AP-2014]